MFKNVKNAPEITERTQFQLEVTNYLGLKICHVLNAKTLRPRSPLV